MFWAASSRSKIDCTGTSISKNWQLRTVLEPSSHWHKLTLNQKIITKRSEQITFWMCTSVEKRQEHSTALYIEILLATTKNTFFPEDCSFFQHWLFSSKLGAGGHTGIEFPTIKTQRARSKPPSPTHRLELGNLLKKLHPHRRRRLSYFSRSIPLARFTSRKMQYYLVTMYTVARQSFQRNN